MEAPLIADVRLPVPLPEAFSYQVPAAWAATLACGMRVLVPFGPRGSLTGIVIRLHHHPPPNCRLKAVLEVLDEQPTLTPIQRQFIDWLADYYLCTPGEVLHAALPTGLRPGSKSVIQRHPQHSSSSPLPPAVQPLWDALPAKGGLTYAQARKVVNNLPYALKILLQSEAVVVSDRLQRRSPATLSTLALAPVHTKTPPEVLLATLSRAPQQQALLQAYWQHAAVLGAPLDRSTLRSHGSPAALRALLQKGVFVAGERPPHQPGATLPSPPTPLPVLSSAQATAHHALQTQLAATSVVLLQGVTGSGKTALYVHHLQQALDEGGSVLFLVPEIALTTQLVTRLQAYFGAQMGVYHSHYNTTERMACWQAVAKGHCRVVVGTRSAIFLPFQQLKLVVIDEEHEPAYKQNNPAPRYHGRDAAIRLAQLHGAQVILGSATPSTESYFNAQQGKYGYVELKERFGSAQLPEVRVIDLHRAQQQRALQGAFSHQLLAALQATVERGEQAILFQNRRGYAPYLQCYDCGTIPQCTQCAVSLTHHQRAQHLRCHYCGYTAPVQHRCKACGSTHLQDRRFGTEKLEEALQHHLPQARVARMDQDTTRRKNSHAQLLQRFARGEVDILVGTQMLAKGLDFPNVTLVGVLDLDGLLSFPDFRSTERAFQLIAQVSGRAGRHHKPGTVWLQTRQPDHLVVPWLVQHDYLGMLQAELAARKNLTYPPYCRLIKLVATHPLEHRSHALAQGVARALPPSCPVLGPEPALVPRIKNLFYTELWVKSPPAASSLQQVKNQLQQACKQALLTAADRKGRIIIDVDPV